MRLLKSVIAASLLLIALSCVAVVCLALYQWRPLNPFGKGISDLDAHDQALYLALEDQLVTNDALDEMRRNGGEVAIAGFYDACGKESKLGPKLAAMTAGKLRTRVDCREDQDIVGSGAALIFADIGPGGSMQAGYRCGGLCGNGNFYTTLWLWKTPVVVKGVGYVN